MTVYLLPNQPIFPHPSDAEEDGLIAIGGDFSAVRLLNAYSSGIFPWFEDNGDIFWFSPDPRLVLFPDRFKVSRSLARTIRTNVYEVRIDTCFREVMEACSMSFRAGQDDTWITPRFIEGYVRLHEMGLAHSVEVFRDGILAGGLYGVSLGSAFFGESMFHRTSDASKVALFYLIEMVKDWQFQFIDCQVETDHFVKLGACLIARSDYLEMLSNALKKPTRKGRWCLPSV